MSDDLVGALLLTCVIVAMVGLAMAVAQPSRSSVVWAAIALGLLPAGILVASAIVWAVGR